MGMMYPWMTKATPLRQYGYYLNEYGASQDRTTFLYLTCITVGPQVSHIQLDFDNGIESARWSSQRPKWYKDGAPTLEYHLSLMHQVGSSAQAAVAALNPPKPAAASGLVHGVLEGQDEDGEDEDEDDNR